MTDHHYTYRATCVRVVDGDTLELDVDLGFGVHKIDRFRLLGIDTPETHGRKKGSPEWEHGKQATRLVDDLMFYKDATGDIEPDTGADVYETVPHPLAIRTHKDKQGKYGRYLCEVTLPDGRDLATVLREAGLAKRDSYESPSTPTR